MHVGVVIVEYVLYAVPNDHNGLVEVRLFGWFLRLFGSLHNNYSRDRHPKHKKDPVDQGQVGDQEVALKLLSCFFILVRRSGRFGWLVVIHMYFHHVLCPSATQFTADCSKTVHCDLRRRANDSGADPPITGGGRGLVWGLVFSG